MTLGTTASLDYQSPAGGHEKRLFLACFFSIFATSSAFIVRAMVITEWGIKFNLSEAQKGASWPGGLVAMGVVTLLMGTSVSWEYKVALVFIPTALYGILLIGQKFPVQERVAAGVSYADMMREFGAASAFILAWFLTMATLTVIAVSAPNLAAGTGWDALNNWAPPIVAVICAAVFFAMYK